MHKEKYLSRCHRCGRPLYPGERVIKAFGGYICFDCRHAAIDERISTISGVCDLCGKVKKITFVNRGQVVCDDCRSEFLRRQEKILVNRLRQNKLN